MYSCCLQWVPSLLGFIFNIFFLKLIAVCVLSMWGKIMIPMYRLLLHSLYGPWCLLSTERQLNLITHSLDSNIIDLYASPGLREIFVVFVCGRVECSYQVHCSRSGRSVLPTLQNDLALRFNSLRLGHLTRWGWDKMAAIFQVTFSNAFFHWKCIDFD